MFQNVHVNLNPPSFLYSLLSISPCQQTSHCSVVQSLISPYLDSHVFSCCLQGTHTDHEEKCQYSCNVCSKKCTEQRKAKRHQLAHSGEWPFGFDVCNKSFSQQNDLKRHLRIHIGTVGSNHFAAMCVISHSVNRVIWRDIYAYIVGSSH
jgi:hypothetical protein